MTIAGLVVHQDQEVRQALVAVLRARGIQPFATPSAGVGQSLLGDHPFVLAVMDCQPGTGDLLTESYRESPELITIVFDQDADRVHVKGELVNAHPGVLTDNPELGIDHLAKRIDKLIGRPLGDLVLRGGVVIHVPTGAVFRHPVAARLLAAYPRGIVVDDHPGIAAICRCREWLRRTTPSIQIVRNAMGSYSMVLAISEQLPAA